MKDRIKLGQITSAVGIRGEVKVYPYTDSKERFEEISELEIENRPAVIEKVRYAKDMVVLKLHGVDDRNSAEILRGKNLYMDRDELWEIPEDTYFVRDLIGLLAVDEDGNEIGRLSDVIQNKAQDIYEIETEENGKFLLPAVKEFILSIDLEKKILTVRLIEGIREI